MAGWKTDQLTALVANPFVTRPVGIYASSTLRYERGVVEYDSDGLNSSWIISLRNADKSDIQPGVSVLLPGTLTCATEQLMPVNVVHGNLSGSLVSIVSSDRPDTYAAAVSAFIGSALQNVFDYKRWKIHCNVPAPLQQNQSFAGRGLVVEFVTWKNLAPLTQVPVSTKKLPELQRIDVAEVPSLTFATRINLSKNVQIFGGLGQSAASTVLRPEENALVTYEDEQQGNRRDMGFVVVGALIALGAAMAIEALRTLFEWFSERLAAMR